MKIASTVFAIIGMIADLVVAFVYTELASGICWVFWILTALCWLFGVLSIALKNKNIALGIAMIIFVNPLSGIFYLCWNGEDY